MDDDIRAVVQAIHDSPVMAALVVAGAGSAALGWLLGVAGATRTVLDASVPYSSRAMAEYLGWTPVKHASAETARSLAAAAFARARRFREDDGPVVGVSCAATIATDRLKRGEHRCHVGVWDGETVTVHSLVLEKGRRSRASEEELVSRLVLRQMAAACGVSLDVALELMPGETVETRREAVGQPVERLLMGEVDKLTVYGQEVMAADEPVRDVAVLSGSFNPLHSGHLALARVAGTRLGRPVLFELSVFNVDKPPLSAAQIRARLAQFVDLDQRVVLTREPLYVGKAPLLPGCTFVIGFDTAQRLVDPAYYGNDPAQMVSALETIHTQGCQFLIAGREVDNQFRTLNDLTIPPGFEGMFEAIPEHEFRVNLSSTELRAHGLAVD